MCWLCWGGVIPTTPSTASPPHHALLSPHAKHRQAFSEDGALYAYMLSSGGSDWRTIHVKVVDQGTGGTTGERAVRVRVRV